MDLNQRPLRCQGVDPALSGVIRVALLSRYLLADPGLALVIPLHLPRLSWPP